MLASFNSLGFDVTYSCEILDGLSGTAALPLAFGFSGARQSKEGLVLEVLSEHGIRWCGNFAEGDHGIVGAYGTPDAGTLLAVARGQGYLVQVETPRRFEILPTYPVEDVRGIPQLKLVVLATLTHLVAYGATGSAWKTRRISSEGLRIESASPTEIAGVAWDASTDTDVCFSVDLRTGQVTGGIDW